jgi:hypothetical protein
MSEINLKNVLSKKQERQLILNDREKAIDNIDLDLLSSNIKKSLSNAGSRFFGFILLIFVVGIILVSAILIFNPNTIYNYLSFIETPEQIANDQANKYLREIDISETDRKDIQNKIIEDIETRNKRNITIVSLILLGLSIFILLIRKHLKSLRLRNKQIREANRLAQNIIADYKIFIAEERVELKEIESIVKNSR